MKVQKHKLVETIRQEIKMFNNKRKEQVGTLETNVQDLEQENTTGTGASMSPGQGGQYATPKAFRKKNNNK